MTAHQHMIWQVWLETALASAADGIGWCKHFTRTGYLPPESYRLTPAQ